MGEAFGPLLQEAREKIKHVEPWQRGTQRTPSTAFCILVRLFQLGLTEAHMTKLLAQKDRPLVRAVGFLYLRYVLKPELLWRYCEDVLIDDGRAILEEGRKETLGEWLRGVLTSQQYHGTQLPRIPTKIDRDIRARVALVDESRERASDNARYLDRFEPGCQVRAIYGDQKNEPAWYDAIVESIEKDTDDAGKERVRFQVQFPDYGHGALVRLGDLDTRSNDSNGESLLKGKKLKVAQSQQSQALLLVANIGCHAGRHVEQPDLGVLVLSPFVVDLRAAQVVTELIAAEEQQEEGAEAGEARHDANIHAAARVSESVRGRRNRWRLGATRMSWSRSDALADSPGGAIAPR